jgi:hypothetical protein
MNSKYFILTNNPLVEKNIGDRIETSCYPEKDAMEILISARDKIHLGDKAVNHPMPGRIRPDETPYKTLLMEYGGKGEVDLPSLAAIEDSISIQQKYLPNILGFSYPDEILADLRLIDWELLKASIEELNDM